MKQTEHGGNAAQEKTPEQSVSYAKMLWLLFFFGGLAGGLFLFLSNWVFLVFRGTQGAVAELWEALPMFVLGGWLAGVVPAVLTGVAAVLLRLCKGWRGSLLMALAGAAVSGVFGGIVSDWETGATLFAAAGALSALLFSAALPKRGRVESGA